MKSENDTLSTRNHSSLIKIIVFGLLYIMVCLCWGTTWIGIKLATATIPPLTAAGLRFVFAFPFFLAFALISKEPLAFPRHKFKFFLIVLVLYFSVPYVLISYASIGVSSGLTALIFSIMPVLTIIFSIILNKEVVNKHQLLGIAVGFVCLLLVLNAEGVSVHTSNFGGVLAVFSAAALHGFCYVLTKSHGKDISVITFNTLPIGVAGLAMTILGFQLENPDFSKFSGESIGAVLYLGLVASVGGFLAYFYLLKRISPTVLSYVFVIFPVVAIYLGAKYADEHVTDSFVYLVLIMLFGFAYTKHHTGKEK